MSQVSRGHSFWILGQRQQLISQGERDEGAAKVMR